MGRLGFAIPRDARRRPGRVGLLTSLLAHLVVITALLMPRAVEFHGAVGPDFGVGMMVSMVDGEALRASLAPSRQVSPLTETSAQALAPPKAEALVRPVDGLDGAPIPDKSEALSSPGVENDAVGEASTPLASAPLNEVQGPSAQAAGGDPLATGSLLNQIARCLPSGMRPNLGFARLVVKVGEGGVLAAAPVIELPLGVATAADRAQADRIVQATLQCGPYAEPGMHNTEIALAPDFSKLGSPSP